jgi:hypothetical protein
MYGIVVVFTSQVLCAYLCALPTAFRQTKSKRNVNMRSTDLPSQTFQSTVTREIQTVASTYQNASIFSTVQGLPDFASSTTVRMARFRRVVVKFSPTEAALGTLEQMNVQLAVYDPVTGNILPMTRLSPLSETNPRSLSFSLPNEFSRWFYTTDSGPLWSIVVYNPTLASTVTTTVATCTLHFDLSLNEAVSQ